MSCAGFVPYTGDGFAVLLPSKYNPSKEKDFQGVVLRYEDNGDAVNNLVVIKMPTSKTSIEQFGDTSAFLSQLQNLGLFGKQAYTGKHLDAYIPLPSEVASGDQLGSSRAHVIEVWCRMMGSYTNRFLWVPIYTWLLTICSFCCRPVKVRGWLR